MTMTDLKKLTSLQAEDAALWAPATSIDVAYTQRALRILTMAIEGDVTFDAACDMIRDMQGG